MVTKPVNRPYKKPGAKPYEPTDLNRGKVLALKACGGNHNLIAKEIGCNRKTLEKYYGPELAEAEERQIMNVESNLYKLTKTNTGAAVFFLINRAPERWKDRKQIDVNAVGARPPPDFSKLSAEKRAILRKAAGIMRTLHEPKLINGIATEESDDDVEQETE